MKENYCSTCGQEFKPGDLTVRCRLCMRNYHGSCWEKTKGCTTWACAGKPTLEDEEIPISYKRCQFCGEKIVSFATKCRYCRSSLEPPEAVLEDKNQKKQRVSGDIIRKDPILSSLLNLIFPGAGYMYLGLFSKGLFWFLIAIAAWFFTRALGLIAVYLWVMYDSPRVAVRMNWGQDPDGKTAQRP